MGRIRQLPPDIANKIAAGEVIERPASVVKELVENALDAGASKIDIELEDAGKQLIRVSDNGGGMDADDLALCFADHATSKIAVADDLFYIDTMGFRGEALASIGSISHARVVSRATEANGAYEVTNHGGEIAPPRPTAGAPGTVVEVANLFFNTPVRRRFLRQNSTEAGHVLETVQRMALAHADIGFSLTNEGKSVFRLAPGGTRRERVLEFGGSKLKDDLIEVNDFDEYASLSGYVGSVNLHRPNSRDLHLFVNRRSIRDRGLLQAVLLAYRELIPHGRYPLAWLFLDLDPSEVDVNVHPTKIEVRFVQAGRLFGKIKAAVQEAVLRSGQLPRINLADKRIESIRALGAAPPQARVHQAMAEFMARHGTRPDGATAPFAPVAEARPGSAHEPDLELAAPGYDTPEHGGDAASSRLQSLLSAEQLAAARSLARKSEVAQAAAGPEVEVSGTEAAARTRPSGVQPSLMADARGLFQVGDAFIMVEVGDGIVLIDQHAYHERVLFWQFENRIAGRKPEVQRLLVPEPLELSPRAAAMLGEHRDVFREFGFEIEPFGAGGWACYAAPKFIRNARINDFIQGSLEELAVSGRTRDPAELRRSMVDMMACKAAIKAGEALSAAEIQALLEEGAKVPHTFACPHGRPTTFKLGFTDLEKFFHRR